jgi:hypothetical protein
MASRASPVMAGPSFSLPCAALIDRSERRNEKTWSEGTLKPIAQKKRFTITLAAVCSSREPTGSNFTTKLRPVVSLATNPGLVPPTLACVTTSGMRGGPPLSGPRTASSIETVRMPMRFVNHDESGTSSSAFTLRARLVAWSSSARVVRRSATMSAAYW